MKPAAAKIDWDQVRARLAESERALQSALEMDPARVRAVFEKRAEKLARRKQKAAVAPTAPAIVFRIGSERYGMGLEHVSEVLPFSGCTPLPGAADPALGLINCHGEVWCLISLAKLLGIENTAAGGYIIGLKRGLQLAFKVDALDGVMPLGVVGTVPEEGPSLDRRYVRGFAAENIILLDMDAVLGHPACSGRRAN